MQINLFSCTNCFNRNTVTVKARWTRLSLTLALTLGLTLSGAAALWFILPF